MFSDDYEYYSPLYEAVKKGDAALCRALVKGGARLGGQGGGAERALNSLSCDETIRQILQRARK